MVTRHPTPTPPPAPGFNARAYRLDRHWRRLLQCRLLLLPWHRYQWERARVAYLPALARTADCKSLATVAFELALLTARWRCLPIHYLRYGLYRAAQRRSDVLRYLPETVLYYRLLPSASADEILLDDKRVTKALLGAVGIRTPRTVGYVRDRRLTWGAVTAPAAELVIKPQRHSSGGDGVQVVTRAGSAIRTLDGRLVDPGVMRDESMLEERVVPSPETAGWGGDASLNTFRVYTLAGGAGTAPVVGALFKVGAGAGAVDNAHTGGIYVRADPRTERLAGAGIDERMVVHAIDRASGRTFSGAPMPGLRRLCAVAEAAAGAFTETPFIGWDIAINQDREPVVIEGNSSPGLTPLQRTHGGMAPVLEPLLRARARR
jgi:hypothetical protein